MNTDKASRLRQELHRTGRQIAGVLREVMRREPMVRGIVYNLRRKCGKAGCRCGRGELHECWVFSGPDDGGVRRLRPVPKGALSKWSVLTERYRRARKARARLVNLFAEALRIVDDLERERTVNPPQQQRRSRWRT
jgi:hypothetical protein